MKTLTFVMMVFFSGAAFAAGPAATTENTAMPTTPTQFARPADQALISNQPCKADREKFCADVKQGGGAIVKCLKAHKDELSESCKAAGEIIKEKIVTKAKEIHEACASELKNYCKDIRGPKQKLECLRGHTANLSPECAAALPAKR